MKKSLIICVLGVALVLSGCEENNTGSLADNVQMTTEAQAGGQEDEATASNSTIIVENNITNSKEQEMETQTKYTITRQELSSLLACSNDEGTRGSSAFMQPILQNPTQTGVTVEWFTEGAGRDSRVLIYSLDNLLDYAEKIKNPQNENKSNVTKPNAETDRNIESKNNDCTATDGKLSNYNDNWLSENILTSAQLEELLSEPLTSINATSFKLSRLRGGQRDDNKDDPAIACDIYKHVALIDNLPENHGLISERYAYRIISDDKESPVYSLAASPSKDTGVKILLSSDHQTKPMVAANIQMAYETEGYFDAVFMNGDLVDVADRCYDWFYADNAFFRVLTGTADSDVNAANYKGAPILQETPMFTAIGNHDVMGVYDDKTPLSTQFNEPRTKAQAEAKWNRLIETGTDSPKDIDSQKQEYIQNHSYNTITTEEIFENPSSTSGGEKYYCASFGNLSLISLDVSRVWRLQNVGLGGKYSEIPGISEDEYAGGEFIFEDVSEGSKQINFLDNALMSDDYKNSEYKIVMFHSEAHSLGGNQIPAFTNPVAKQTISPITGQTMTIYDYPIENDFINKVIEPRLIKSGVNLLFEAHSHLWNRFRTESGMNVLETSNVGNSYGGYTAEDKLRDQRPTAFLSSDPYYPIRTEWEEKNYVMDGDPYGLEAIEPNISKLPDDKPYLDSNTVTAFSVLDSERGCVDSFYYDTEKKDSEVVLFDSFSLK